MINITRRPPKPPTTDQIQRAKIEYLERQLAQVVANTNAHIAAIEARANEEIRLSQAAQVAADNKILAAWQENAEILYRENESLRAEVARLSKEIERLRSKTRKSKNEGFVAKIGEKL